MLSGSHGGVRVTVRRLWQLVANGQLATLMAIGRLQRASYRLGFLSAALQSGLFARLAERPATFDELAVEFAPDRACHEGLRAWLDFGVCLGELGEREGRYALRGRLARRLLSPHQDAAAALLQEAGGLHHALLTEGLRRLRDGRTFDLADQDGELVARSSRILEPFVFDAVEQVVPANRPLHLLEIGCGSGIYIRHAAERNPHLTALGLELQPRVAQAARANLRNWGVEARVSIECADVRARVPEPKLDLATLHNNIYYFPGTERPALLAHVRAFLRPGGRLLITTACRGGSPGAEILDVWAAMTQGCGRLPPPAELESQLLHAGFGNVQHRKLIPGEAYYAFTAEVDAGTAAPPVTQ